jgi:seryl-tRNA synthetase
MWSADSIVHTLEQRGELWSNGPGLVGLRGDTLDLFLGLQSRILELAKLEAAEEWRTPAGIPLEALARADYFASFPQWLTMASHFPADERTLERIATSPDAARAVRSAPNLVIAALPPAVCYHIYHRFADRVIDSPSVIGAQGTCWRHEGEQLRPLERGWAFTMREVVCIGSATDVGNFSERMTEATSGLAKELGLEASIEIATDPFFAPTSRGKSLLQRLRASKHELLLPLNRENRIAAASFNNHGTFYGDSFTIELRDGSPAHSACAAFGLERWLLAFLVTHGPDRTTWPDPLLEVETHGS